MSIAAPSSSFTQIDASPFPQLAPALRNLTHQMPMELALPIAKGPDIKLASYLMADAELKNALERQRDVPTLTKEIFQAISGLFGTSPAMDLYLVSFLYRLDPKPDHLDLIFQLANRCELDIAALHRVYWHMQESLYASGNLTEPTIFETVYRFYLSLSDTWRRHSTTAVREWIPPNSRNANHVIVLTNQLQPLPHGPSADTYETIKALAEMGLEVCLVNTADIPNEKTATMFDPKVVPYPHEFFGIDLLTYEGTSYGFLQCPPNMPDVSAALNMVKQIRSFNPKFILSLGGSSPVADLCAGFTTVATIPFDGIFPIAATQILVVPRTLSGQDRNLAARLRFAEQALYSNQYAFAPQVSAPPLKRAALAIPKDAVAFCLVGNTGDPELSPGFLKMLNEACRLEPRLFFVFVGEFDSTERRLASFANLQERSCFLGIRSDTSAIFGACDAYLNPPRQSGASSAVAAMAAGLPVLSQAWGDVVEQACPTGFYERWTNAAQIASFAKQLLSEPGLIKKISLRSRKRAAECTDRRNMLSKLIAHIEDGHLDRQAVFDG